MPEERAALWFPVIEGAIDKDDSPSHRKHHQVITPSLSSNFKPSRVLAKQTAAKAKSKLLSKLPVSVKDKVVGEKQRSHTFVVNRDMAEYDIQARAKERGIRNKKAKEDLHEEDEFDVLDRSPRSLTPIPEHKETYAPPRGRRRSLDSVRSINPRRMLSSVPDIVVDDYEKEDDGEFNVEVPVRNFAASELRFIIGRNRVRIIGEKKIDSQEGDAGFHKIVNVPSYVDPNTVKTTYEAGKVKVTGSKLNKNRKWTVGHHGLMTVKHDGSTRVTLDLPDGIEPDNIKVKTVTKIFLVVSASVGNRKSSQTEEEQTLESFELPPDCNYKHLKTRIAGNSTVVVEISGHNQTGEHRPRAFTF